jgi:hypothetical protein
MRQQFGPLAQYADSGMFKTRAEVPTDDKATLWSAASLAAAGLGAIPANFDDGSLWMRPVGTGKTFSDLYGNVAELVFDDPEKFQKHQDKSFQGIKGFLDQSAAQLFVVGGSFMSAPELGVDRQQLVNLENGYADLGFRLAFVAAPAAIVDRLKDAMKKQQYVVAAGPATAPAN